MNSENEIIGFLKNDNIEWENLGGGVKRKIMAFNKDLMMVIVSFEKDAIGYLHKHIHSQVTYVAKGSFEVTIVAEKQKLNSGDVFFTSPNYEHGVLALEDGILVDVFSPYREDFIKK